MREAPAAPLEADLGTILSFLSAIRLERAAAQLPQALQLVLRVSEAQWRERLHTAVKRCARAYGRGLRVPGADVETAAQ